MWPHGSTFRLSSGSRACKQMAHSAAACSSQRSSAAAMPAAVDGVPVPVVPGGGANALGTASSGGRRLSTLARANCKQ